MTQHKKEVPCDHCSKPIDPDHNCLTPDTIVVLTPERKKRQITFTRNRALIDGLLAKGALSKVEGRILGIQEIYLFG